MAQHHHTVRAIFFFIWSERSAEFRGRTEQSKEVNRYR